MKTQVVANQSLASSTSRIKRAFQSLFNPFSYCFPISDPITVEANRLFHVDKSQLEESFFCYPPPIESLDTEQSSPKVSKGLTRKK